MNVYTIMEYVLKEDKSSKTNEYWHSRQKLAENIKWINIYFIIDQVIIIITPL